MMSLMVMELYDALRQAGVDETVAKQAAAAVMGRDREPGHELVTTSILKAELADLRTEVIKWNVGTLIALAGVLIAAIKLL